MRRGPDAARSTAWVSLRRESGENPPRVAPIALHVSEGPLGVLAYVADPSAEHHWRPGVQAWIAGVGAVFPILGRHGAGWRVSGALTQRRWPMAAR